LTLLAALFLFEPLYLCQKPRRFRRAKNHYTRSFRERAQGDRASEVWRMGCNSEAFRFA